MLNTQIKLVIYKRMLISILLGTLLVLSVSTYQQHLYRQPKTTILPSASPMIDCNHYTNPKYGLSFQCPQNLNLKIFESDGSDRNSIRGAERKISVGLPNTDNFYIELFIYRSTLSPKLWWESDGSGRYSKSSVNSITRSKIAGNEATLVKLTEHYSEYDDDLELIVTAKNGLIYLIENSTSNKDSLKISNEIISTFTLTNSQ